MEPFNSSSHAQGAGRDEGSPIAVLLPRSPYAAGQARAHVVAHFGDQISEQALRNVQTVASELVNNAIVHGRGEVTLEAALGRGSVRVEVIDQGTGNTPGTRERADGDTGGWGLQLVQALSRRWGVGEGTTHVWAEGPTS